MPPFPAELCRGALACRPPAPPGPPRRGRPGGCGRRPWPPTCGQTSVPIVQRGYDRSGGGHVTRVVATIAELEAAAAGGRGQAAQDQVRVDQRMLKRARRRRRR